MINSVGELRQALTQLELAKAELAAEDEPFDDGISVGAMIEIPSAALTVNMMAKHVDFFSIGTNDLIQYTLAIDRNDDAVSHLYDPTHPAVLYLIWHTIKTANKAGVPVSICGEMAGDARLTRLLLGMGLRKFSMPPANLLAVKQIVLGAHLDKITPIVSKILRTNDADKIHDLLTQLNTLAA